MVSGEFVEPPASTPAVTTGKTTGPVPAKNFSGVGYTKETVIHSLSELKDRAPEVWDSMLKGIAQHIISEMREHAERIKKKMREARQQ